MDVAVETDEEGMMTAPATTIHPKQSQLADTEAITVNTEKAAAAAASQSVQE
jgi:hypothetical protein